MRFRETLWFKKGVQDSEVRDEPDDADDAVPANTLPIEDRYRDDGTVGAVDTRAFGVHTGTTEYMPKLLERVPPEHAVDEHALVRELKRGRVKVFAVMGSAALVLCAAVALLV